jgi:hypothetical protein
MPGAPSGEAFNDGGGARTVAVVAIQIGFGQY